jgi:diphthamide synthase (EF-2-diphthine--ammonia ligase)
LSDLPDGVDPCGENGEYHSFVFDAPFFSKPIEFEKGEIVYRKYTASEPNDQSTVDSNAANTTGNPFDNGFWYCDLLSSNS